jgi:hypothetical protein
MLLIERFLSTEMLAKSGDHNLITRPLVADSVAASASASARIPSLAPTSGAAPLETAVMK